MPSRQVSSLVTAAAFALLAIFLFCARDEHGAWQTDLLSWSSLTAECTCGSNSPDVVAHVSDAGRGEAKPVGKRRGKGGTMATASSAKLSEEIKDPATGLALPRTKRFSKSDLTCLGVGVRAKSIAVAKVNVYTVGLYVEPKGARGALNKYIGSDPAGLTKDSSVFKILGSAGFNKYLHLVFARSVGAKKVVEALTSVKGVHKDVLDRLDKRRGQGLNGVRGIISVFLWSNRWWRITPYDVFGSRRIWGAFAYPVSSSYYHGPYVTLLPSPTSLLDHREPFFYLILTFSAPCVRQRRPHTPPVL